MINLRRFYKEKQLYIIVVIAVVLLFCFVGYIATSFFKTDWILIYTLISIPFGQIVNRLIRTYKFRKYLQKLDAGEGAEAA